MVEQKVIPAMELEEESAINEEEMVAVVEKLDTAIEAMDKEIAISDSAEKRKQIRNKRKRPKQLRKTLSENIARKQKYNKQLDIMGDRNSYSKTDPDATFMRIFGFLKANLRFNRFTLRGKINAKIEMGLALMAVNLRKYTRRTAAA